MRMLLKCYLNMMKIGSGQKMMQSADFNLFGAPYEVREVKTHLQRVITMSRSSVQSADNLSGLLIT